MQNRFIYRVVLILIALTNITSCSSKYVVADLDAGDNRHIIIMAASFHDNLRPVYYQVRIHDQVVVETSYLSSEDPDELGTFKFKLVSNKNKDICGVMVEGSPRVIILHNFSTNQTWPRCEKGTFEECDLRGLRIFKELQKDNPELVFDLR